MTPRTDIPKPRQREGTFSVEPFLAAEDAANCTPGSETMAQLEALVKRVTISGSLHAHYTPDITRPVGHELAAPEYRRLYCEILVKAATSHGDWKLLNAAFTALDSGVTDDQDIVERARVALTEMGSDVS